MIIVSNSVFLNPWLISIISAIIGIIATILVYRFSKREKLLLLAYTTELLISDYKSEINELTIKYKNEEIENLNVLKIAFWNSGKSTIVENDISSTNPIIFQIDKESKILNISIVGKSEKSINPIVTKMNNYTVSIGFEYLNYNDGFVIQLLHTGKNTEFSISGTIKTYNGKLTNEKSLINNDIIKKKLNRALYISFIITVVIITITAFSINYLFNKQSHEIFMKIFTYSLLSEASVFTVWIALISYHIQNPIPKSLKKYFQLKK